MYSKIYIRIEYSTENICERNKFQYFSDESLFSHRNNNQFRILGTINTQLKNFSFNLLMIEEA